MIHSLQQADARRLLRDGWVDEDVERLTGLSLSGIVLLRAEAASAIYGGTAAPPRTPRPPFAF